MNSDKKNDIESGQKVQTERLRQLDIVRRHRLRMLKEKYNFIQREIAKRTEEDPANVSRYIRGKTISLSFWKRVKAAFPNEIKQMEKEDAARKRKKLQPTQSADSEPLLTAQEWEQSYKLGKSKENQTLREFVEKEMNSFKDRQEADRIVMFEALARLEGKPVDALLKEADQRKLELEKTHEQAGEEAEEGTNPGINETATSAGPQS